ncbi:MAG TPA: hypothetical protein VFN74_01325 [Chloroflexota bacterium]|nr:hypothetical protein [Chloroflexota bacterium]
MSALSAPPRLSVHVTRRGAVAAAGIGAAALLSGCDLRGQSARTRQPVMYEILAADTPGRQRRLEAWDTRYSAETGVRLLMTAPDRRFVSEGDLATTRQLIDDAAAGTRPGIAWLSHAALQDVARAGALGKLDDLVRRDRFDLKAFMPCALQPGYALEGPLLSLPDEVDAGQLYFNRQHLLQAGIDFRRAGLDFERPDSRWDTLRRVALDLLFVRREQPPWLPGALPLDVWGWANGGGWIAPDGRHATFDRPENVAALEWITGAVSESTVARASAAEQAPEPARRGTDADPIGGHPFLDGRLSLWMDSGRFMSTLAWTRPDLPIGYVESPRRRAGAPLVTWASSSGYALRRGSPDSLWDALRFLVTEDAAIVDAAAEALGQAQRQAQALLDAAWRGSR